MPFHTGRRYYFPIFSVLVQSLQKSPSVSLPCAGNEEDCTQQCAQVPQSDGETLAVLVAIVCERYSNRVSCAASYAYRLHNTVAIRAVLAITR